MLMIDDFSSTVCTFFFVANYDIILSLMYFFQLLGHFLSSSLPIGTMLGAISTDLTVTSDIKNSQGNSNIGIP